MSDAEFTCKRCTVQALEEQRSLYFTKLQPTFVSAQGGLLWQVDSCLLTQVMSHVERMLRASKIETRPALLCESHGS